MSEELLSIEQVVHELDSQFQPLEPDLVGFRLVGPGLSRDDIRDLESKLSLHLPESFRLVATKFNLGSLTIGPTVFGSSGLYAVDLLALNSQPDTQWWGGGGRPEALLMIANSDPFEVILDCSTGEILALQHGRQLNETSIVARNLELYLRGLGTVFVGRQAEPDSRDLGRMVGLQVGSSPEGLEYWLEMAA